MSRNALLAAVCFAFPFITHLQAEDAPAFIELKGNTRVVGPALFSPDGKKVAAYSALAAVRIWDAESGKELYQLVPDAGANAELPNNDGRGFGDDWSIACSATFTYFSPRLAFSSDGKKIVSLCLDMAARIWDVESGEELQKLEGHTKPIIFVTFSPDGRKVATGSVDETVRIWDTKSGKELHKLEGRIMLEDQMDIARSINQKYSGDFVSAAAFTSDGKKLVMMCNPETYTKSRIAQVYDAESGQKLDLELDTASFRSLFFPAPFSPDGKKVTMEQLPGAGGSIVVVLDADAQIGQYAAVDSKGQSPARVTHGASDGNLTRFAAFSPDGKRFATVGSVNGYRDGTARIWDTESGRELYRLETQTVWGGYAAFSPDGKRFATAGADGTARIWDLERLQSMESPAIKDFE